MGEASAKAQQLSAPITSASRMQSNRHRLYVLKDGLANHGKGAAIGFLKVGHKKLFVLDGRGAHNEMEPLCVLDFYVHVSLQRHGYGKELFDYMIQVNNFVVFESFFRDRQMRGERLVHRTIPKKVEQDIKPYSLTVRDGAPEDQELPWPFNQKPSLTRSNSLGRNSHRQPSRAQFVHQEALRHVRVARPQAVNGVREADDLVAQRRRTSTPEQQGMVAMGNMYSRYSKTSAQSPECVMERSWSAVSNQDSPQRSDVPQLGPGSMDSPTAEPDQLTQRPPPLDLRGLTRDSDSDSPWVQTPCAGNLDTPLAPRALERPATGQRAPSEGEPRAGEGGRLEWPEERDGDVAAACDNQQAQACREEQQTRLQAGKGRGSWTDLRGPLSAQWIRHKHEFRNTRPW
ncbi:alpha-tubulin N-acetyltransferase 1 isoform X2 [Stegostoma tigrinum]|uniref:alpha-tubulin N-acetyltransferase 1 isoform X2 n=1 Tax=Stegostoma tigrinum TaxID=3053191 RepID=UPI002870185B|nr:alpha-tubulin N-acetyltransferase 1 isoform X2 [Stegostoma tigrinum]